MNQIIHTLSLKQTDFQTNSCYNYNRSLQSDAHHDCFLSGKADQQKKIVRLEADDILIDRFVIEKYLGHGSFGAVYQAKDTLDNKKTALKIIDLGPTNEEIASFQLKKEMSIYCQILDHRYVIRVYDLHIAQWGGTHLLVLSMEYADGGNFRQWLLEHKNDLNARRETGLEYFKMACAGVGAVHDANVAHLDLKPENLLFAKKILKISDFGTSLCKKSYISPNLLIGQTSSNRIFTPVYMSPEHFGAPHPEDLNFEADIYALGVMLYELFHPHCLPPFTGSYDRLRELHTNVTAPRIPGVDDNLAHIISRCLDKNPSNRYPSVWDLLEDLEKGYYRATADHQDTVDEKKNTKRKERYQSAIENFSKGDFNEAIRLTENILSVEPENTSAKLLNNELKSRFDQANHFYQAIEEILPTADLQELTTFLCEAANLFPDHSAGHLIQTKLGIRTAAYRAMMEQGVLALKDKQWKAALEQFQNASQVHSGTMQLKTIIEILTRIKDLRFKMNQALGNLDFTKALILGGLVDQQEDEVSTRIQAVEKNMGIQNETG